MGDGEGDVPHGVGVVGTGWPDKRRNGGEQDTQRHLSPASWRSRQWWAPATVGRPIACPPPQISAPCAWPLQLSAPSLGTSCHPFLGGGQAWVWARGRAHCLTRKAGSSHSGPAPHSCPHIATSPVQSLRYQFFFKYLFLPSLPSPIGTPQYFFLFLFYPLFCFLQN